MLGRDKPRSSPIIIVNYEGGADLIKPEYNILQVAGSRMGSKHTEETKAKLIAYKHTEEVGVPSGIPDLLSWPE